MAYTTNGKLDSIGVQIGKLSGTSTSDNIGSSISNSNKNITTSTTQIFAANENRTFLSLVNNNQYDVWIAFGTDAVVGSGILLKKYGGVLMLDRYSITKAAVNGIASGGTNNIGTIEGSES